MKVKVKFRPAAKHSYPSALSALVLEPQRRQRTRRMGLAMLAFTILLTSTNGLIQLHYARAKAAALAKLATEVNAPSWARFVSAHGQDNYEYKTDHDDEGLPHDLMINGESWTVVQANHFNDIDATKLGPIKQDNITEAETYCEERTIAYIKAPKQALRVNMMHEIFHAGACLHGGDAWWNSINPTETTHPGIYHLSDFMSSFMYENPKFVTWVITP